MALVDIADDGGAAVAVARLAAGASQSAVLDTAGRAFAWGWSKLGCKNR